MTLRLEEAERLRVEELHGSGYSRYGDDRLREECGVFGVFGHPEAGAITALGLHALQHRGQEACGIVAYDGRQFHSERRMGLVGDNFSRASVIERLQGHIAIGHNRYSTCGEAVLRNVQPLFADIDTGGFAVAHNGNLTNALTLRQDLISTGAICQSTSDTEVILHLLSRSKKRRIVERFVEALREIEGAYALVCLTNEMLIGARDPVGIRPLVLGKLGSSYVLASETCALDMVGAEFIREVENGEVVVITADGIESHRPFPMRPARPCIFEYIYFARPDSVIGGRTVYDIRKQMGVQLANEAPANVDVIVPIPDSGVPAAIGFAQESNVPFELGIIRNHYVGRTFIEPEQRIRALGVKLKHSANASVIRGKRIVLVDDSVVRGTTSKKIVRADVRGGRARSAHAHRLAAHHASRLLRHRHAATRSTCWRPTRTWRACASSSAPTASPSCRSTASTAPSAIDQRDARAPQFTDHCFTGEYPTPLTDQSGHTDAAAAVAAGRGRLTAASSPAAIRRL